MKCGKSEDVLMQTGQGVIIRMNKRFGQSPDTSENARKGGRPEERAALYRLFERPQKTGIQSNINFA